MKVDRLSFLLDDWPMKKIYLLILAFVTTTAFAVPAALEVIVMTPKEIQKVIGDFPKAGSAAEAEDFKILLQYQQTRTADDCKFAEADSHTSLDVLFGGKGGILSKSEVTKLKLFLVNAYANAGVNSLIAKKLYKRPRPYLANSEIKPCIGLEKSYAYPSGHTLMARLTARVLSQVYPERAEKFMARAAEYSLNRVIGGVHHPSDVHASFILADYLAQQMVESDDFISELNSL
jgi:acid phosphatase (class A)